MIPNKNMDKMLTAHNTQGGITVTLIGAVDEYGVQLRDITLKQDEKLTFTSTVDNISQITVETKSYDDEEEYEDEDEYIPVAEGWTWDAAKHTFTWQGTPSTTVEMIASEDIELENIQIRFTID